MICDWLYRGVLCSWKARKHFGLERQPLYCNWLDMAAAVVAEELLVPADRWEQPPLAPAVVEALETLAIVLTPAEAALSTVLPEGPVMATLAPVPFGYSIATVFAGPPSLVARASEFFSPLFPIFEMFNTYVALVEAGQDEWGEVAERYGAAAAVSVLADAPAPAYVVQCTNNEWTGQLLLKAMGLRPANATDYIEVPGARIAKKG